jgi:hypothetical protein
MWSSIIFICSGKRDREDAADDEHRPEAAID